MVRTPPQAAQAYQQQQPAPAAGGSTKLKATIPFPILLLLGINAIIGTGIFFVPGIAAKLAGPASLISWFGVAIIALIIAACFAELSGMFPKSGGVYEYTKQGFGEFVGFIVGWTGWIVANITIAMLTIGSLDYLGVILDISPMYRLIIAILFILGMNYISYRGVDMSVKVLLIFAIFTIISLWTLLSWGVYYVSFENLMPIDIFPKISVVIAMVYIMETFFGWETVAYMAEETKNPTKVIPKVMIWGTVGVILLAIGVVTVVLGAVDWKILADSSSPLVEAAKLFMGQTGAKAIAILVFLNIIGGAAAWIVVTPRLVFALGRDKLLPDILSKIHPKYQTPYYAIMVQAALTIIILLSQSYKLLLEMVLPLAIFMYAMTVTTVTVLRFSKPNTPRTFKVPFGKVLPVITALAIVFLASGIEFHTIIVGVMFVLIGIPLYFMEAMLYRPQAAMKMLSISTGLSTSTDKLWLKPKLRQRIIKHLGNIRGHKIIHFGTDASSFPAELAEIVGSKGKVMVMHMSKSHLKAIKKVADKKQLKNLEYFLENADARHRIHKNINDAGAVVAIGALESLKNPLPVLQELNKRMKKFGRVYFVDYDNVFRIMPEQEWMKDHNQMRAIFKQAGFHVRIEEEKGFLWDTLHIYGYKA
jgi:amino acid transporter